MHTLSTGASAPTAYSALVYRSSDQTISDSTATAAAWTTSVFNNNSSWSSGNGSRLLTPVTARYLITTVMWWNNNATGKRGVDLYKNGSLFMGGVNFPGWVTNANGNPCSWIVSATAGDYFELFLFQTSGGSLTFRGSANLADGYSWASIARLYGA